jgi:large subunit ribosomal protein L25
MPEYDIEVRARHEKGKQQAKRLRTGGSVPGVVYGHGESAIPVSVDSKALSTILDKSLGDNIIFNVKMEGEKDAKAVLKELQKDPLTKEVIHVDFQHIHPGEPLTVQVPVILTGSSPGVKQGGILEHVLRKVEVRCLPSQMPDHFVVDISNLNLGDSLHVSDIYSKDAKILEDKSTPIVSILVPRAKVEVEKPEEELVAAEEGAAEGEAPKEEEEEEEQE